MFDSLKITLNNLRRIYFPNAEERQVDREFAEVYRASVKPLMTTSAAPYRNSQNMASAVSWDRALTNTVNSMVQKHPGAEITYEVITVDLDSRSRGLQRSTNKYCGNSIEAARKFTNGWTYPRAFTILVQAFPLNGSEPKLVKAINLYQNANGISVI